MKDFRYYICAIMMATGLVMMICSFPPYEAVMITRLLSGSILAIAGIIICSIIDSSTKS